MANFGNNGPGMKVKKRANGTLIEDYGENHPAGAHMILGHGNEGWKLRVPIEPDDTQEIIHKKRNDRIPDMIKVPKGSIVVIKSHSGDVRWANEVRLDQIKMFSKENEQYVLDPITYIDEITKLFGSVAIYREGDLCPNIIHAYTAHWERDKSHLLYPSGIVPIPLRINISKEELNNFLTIPAIIPKSMTIKEYKEQRNSPSGFNIENMFKLMINKNGIPILLNECKERIDTLDENKTFGEVFDTLFDDYEYYQDEIFNVLPNRIIYAFNCRFIDNHEHFVPETVRMGVKSKNNLNTMVKYHIPLYKKQARNEHNVSTNTSAQKRSNYIQEKTHLQRYLNAIGKSGIQKYRKIEDTNHKGEFKILTNPDYVSPITKSALNRQGMQRSPNNSIKIANTRKRVSNMPPEIIQQISETAQRKLGTVALSKINKNSNKQKGILDEYKNIFYIRNTKDPKYKQDIIDKLKKVYPEIEKRHFNNVIDAEVYNNANQYNKLTRIKGLYPNRNNNITKKIKSISNRLINKNVKYMYNDNKKNYKKLLERILTNNNSRKNNIHKQLIKIEKSLISDILKSPCPDYAIEDSYKLLYMYKDDPEYKGQVQEKLDELAICIYNKLNKHSYSWNDNLFIENLNLDPTIHHDLIKFLLDKHSKNN